MSEDEDEQGRLRSVALQTAKSILLARQLVERELAQERERLRTTLASIGDGVVSTDAEGRVTFLNGVAEQLTGWSQADAAGRPLTEVFVIVHEQTRRPVDNPALRALREGRVVELANHTILIARDGGERPIDDSAAPMRDAAGATVGAVLVFRDVTQRRRAAEALRRSEERARLALDIAQLGTWAWSPGGGALLADARCREVCGLDPVAAIDLGDVLLRVHPDDRARVEAALAAALRPDGSGLYAEEFRFVHQDGHTRWVVSRGQTLFEAHGDVMRPGTVLGTVLDISERKRSEQVLRNSEGRHRFLAELAAATQPLTDAVEVMAVTARLLAEHLGVDRCAYAEVEDESTFVITGDHPRGVPSIVGRWPVSGFGAECERRMLANEPYVIDDVDADPRAGGDLSSYRATAIQAVICVPLHKAGKFAAAMAVHQKTPRRWTTDEVELVCTVVERSWESIERTRVARGLREAADRLALALAAADLGDWSWDVASDLVDFSPRAAEVFGIPPGPHMTWTRMQGLIHPDDRAYAREHVALAVDHRVPYDVEYRVQRVDGEVWVSVLGRAQFDPAGQVLGMYGVVRDIGDRKRLEQALRERAEQLAESDRKKDEFIAVLAHELRNPLAPVRHGLQVMRLAAGDPVVVARVRAMMDRQLGHMVRLIDDLLDLSRLNRNKLHIQRARVLLGDVVNNAVEAARPAIEAAGHVLTVTLPNEPVQLDADLTRLAQVFSNLLTNSAKYTEAGGRITLVAELRGAEVVLTVRDTGIGIPAAALPRIFDMFSQVDQSIERSAGGLGIGLALVKGLAEMHGGSVSADSAGPGQGSSFTVRLPVLDAGARPAAAGPEEPRSTPGRRVLVVDDNEDSAATMAMMLELLGDEVVTAHDGLDAIEVAERFRPEVILMDVGMPRLNGLDATRQIRARPWGHSVIVVALTGWGQDSDRARSSEAGCDGHLVKPVSLPDLERLLTELRARRPRD